MAVRLLAHELSDLCIGKPALKPLPLYATVAEALVALRSSEDNCISVWYCVHSARIGLSERQEELGCRCVGKLSMVDVILYLCRDENLSSPSAALRAPVSEILPKTKGLVVHLEPSASLVEAIDLILKGAQNLVVPIATKSKIPRSKQHHKFSITSHNDREYCWLTQEDMIRFFLNSIGQFSPISSQSIDSLGIVSSEVQAVDCYIPASSALGEITRSLTQQTSVAIIDSYGVLIGEVSPFTLACCDETVTAAITTLTCGELMAYIDGGIPPDGLVRVVMAKLKTKNLENMLEEFTISSPLTSDSSSSSSDEESAFSPKTTLSRSGRCCRSSSYSTRVKRRAEALVCHPKSSLVAVMIQAVAHRVNYLWVVEDDGSLVGIVTISSMIKVFREHCGNS